MKVSSRAGKCLPTSALVDVPRLVTAFYAQAPDPTVRSERVAFGTSGHRGSPFERAFNEAHIVAISQAICSYRQRCRISGPLFLGMDTHALSVPAQSTVLEVLAANGVDVMLAAGDEYTPTPGVSLAILDYNKDRKSGQADGIVITPSHNPPEYGGLKYNPPHGGPAAAKITECIGAMANALLESGLRGVRRMSSASAEAAPTTHRYDYLTAYVEALDSVVDMQAIARSGLHLGVDPLGGAGIHFWGRIAERYGIDLTIVNDALDPTFAFMTADSDGQIRMDPASPFALQRLIGRKDEFDLAFACDTDHDRHGIVTPCAGLMPPNHYFCVVVRYLFKHRPGWGSAAGVGKTIVGSQMIDRVAAALGRDVFEAPVGFKWFAEGLHDGSLAVAGEESAGLSFQRRNGRVWTTDKDGITAALLAAEIQAQTGRDPAQHYEQLIAEHGETFYERIETPATAEVKNRLGQISAEQVCAKQLAGAAIHKVLTHAPGNGEPIGGIQVVTDEGWFAARPSGTEDLYKIYGESFRHAQHLQLILEEARQIVDTVLTPTVPQRLAP